MILVVNTSFPELDHLASGLADSGLLSNYVRPYANLQRKWERSFEALPGLATAYKQSFGRRILPPPLDNKNVRQTAVGVDMLLALAPRVPFVPAVRRKLIRSLVFSRTDAVMCTACDLFLDERMVVASWGCAESVFKKAKQTGAFCVLNYSLAHHRFTRRYLLEEAEINPIMAETLNSHDHPRWLEARLDSEIELADYILVGSRFVRNSFISEGVPKEKLVVIPYGVDAPLFLPDESQRQSTQDFRLLFVGQIGQRKGVSYLLEAMQRINDPRVSLTLVGSIQGDGSAFKRFGHLFRHVPHVPRAELPAIFQQADAFVFPTLVEGMGIAVLEAMASGLPVVTTPNGQGDLVRDGVDGYLVAPRDVEAIVDRVLRLRGDSALCAEMGRNALSRAQEFTWLTYRERTVKLFQNLLHSK